MARLLERGYEAVEDYPGSTSLWRAVHLECGQEVTLRLDRVVRGHAPRDACPCYTAKRVAAEQRTQSTKAATNAAKAAAGMSAAGWEPLEPYPGSHKGWRSRCMDCGSESSPSFHNVSQSAGRSKLCRTCAGRPLVTEDRARAVMLAAGWQPVAPYTGLLDPWLCACVTCGHESTPNYSTTQQGKSRCTKCATRARGLKAMQEFEPTALKTMQDMQLQPLEPYPGANKPWKSRCLQCGSTVSPSCTNVALGIRGCWTCSRPVQAATIRAGKAPAAEARVRAAGYTPLEPYPGMKVPWACLCRCGRETAVWTSAVGEGSRGCRYCCEGGFKPHLRGTTYLIVNERLGALKVGITGVGTDRLRSFQRLGWEVAHLEHFEMGNDAMSVERAILDWWRIELALPAYLSPDDLPIGGSTETAELQMMPVWLAIERIKEVASRMRELASSAA